MVRGRLAVVPVLGLALAGVVVPGAWADSGTVDRRVHRPHIVSPQATTSTTGLSPDQVIAVITSDDGDGEGSDG